MPNRDGTGREGKGARTGRGLGNCPKNDKGNDNRGKNRKGSKGK